MKKASGKILTSQEKCRTAVENLRRQTHIDVGDDSSSLVSQTSQLLVNPKHQNQHNANLIFRQYYVNAMDRSGKTNQFYSWCELVLRLQSNPINFQRIIRAFFKEINRKICQFGKSEKIIIHKIPVLDHIWLDYLKGRKFCE